MHSVNSVQSVVPALNAEPRNTRNAQNGHGIKDGCPGGTGWIGFVFAGRDTKACALVPAERNVCSNDTKGTSRSSGAKHCAPNEARRYLCKQINARLFHSSRSEDLLFASLLQTFRSAGAGGAGLCIIATNISLRWSGGRSPLSLCYKHFTPRERGVGFYKTFHS